jgi:hypothetical protein
MRRSRCKSWKLAAVDGVTAVADPPSPATAAVAVPPQLAPAPPAATAVNDQASRRDRSRVHATPGCCVGPVTSDRRRRAERTEARPQRRDVERPSRAAAEQRPIAAAEHGGASELRRVDRVDEHVDPVDRLTHRRVDRDAKWILAELVPEVAADA